MSENQTRANYSDDDGLRSRPSVTSTRWIADLVADHDRRMAGQGMLF
jgi:hypothetical protein